MIVKGETKTKSITTKLILLIFTSYFIKFLLTQKLQVFNEKWIHSLSNLLFRPFSRQFSKFLTLNVYSHLILKDISMFCKKLQKVLSLKGVNLWGRGIHSLFSTHQCIHVTQCSYITFLKYSAFHLRIHKARLM